MAFRFLLVGAVAALGFDLPQGIDMDAWARSGRAWWHARAAEFEARHGIALSGVEESSSGRPTPDPEPLVLDDDAAFATVIEDVVSAFAADGQVDDTQGPDTSPRLVAGVADAAFGPDFADALNRWADGLSEPEDPATFVAEASAMQSGELAWQGDLPVASISGVAGSAFGLASDRDADRPGPVSPSDSSVGGVDAPETIGPSIEGEPGLARAVQLTGQALQAWFALIQPAGPLEGASCP